MRRSGVIRGMSAGLAIVTAAAVLSIGLTSCLPQSVDIAQPSLRKTPAAQAEEVLYDSEGEYLNYVDRSSVATNSRAKLDENGVVTLLTGTGDYFYNPTTIAQHGLQEWSYYKRWGREEFLAAAVRQADWLVETQNKKTGAWYYHINWNVANMDETLIAPWAGAMVQGQAMSLLTRVASAYPERGKYMRAAKLATQPLTKPVREGGLVNYLQGRPYYEEYPTKTPSFTLNGFQHTLIGLWDLAQTGDARAERLFDEGYDTMVFALPKYDAPPTTAYNLGHLTKPPRELHAADRYHRIHVELLEVLDYMRPNKTVEKWHDKWATYPPSQAPAPPPVTEPPVSSWR